MLGALLSAGTSLLGGLLGKSSTDKANEINQQNALRQEALQREFAQSGIQWKVEDAKKAGVHPLYALGAQTTSYSPVSVGAVGDNSLASGVASAGQDLSRAIAATSSKPTRTAAIAEALTLEKGALENDLLRAQIAKLKGQVGPPMPTLTDAAAIPGQPATVIPEAKPDERPFVQMGQDWKGNVMRWYTDPYVSNPPEDRYAEMSDWSFAPYALARDWWYNFKRNLRPWQELYRRPSSYTSSWHDERTRNARRYLQGRR